ncbi:hypothetical protein CONPUDRAFT_143390 [Coniophora puteana RWD-64-598 SS2]|uniref:F-box domain-containing protein n=1 Tax=Coniophora puteana (strain RWD-64-598) TaxID=741705 RepID=A0A5M3MWM8_CONPW|nr:uncharacterized protein CONPUDRAFT_143390 [Coniophora puteana RWD-64-598 SS2]EIW83526.1 hypothetical protein CONPUDRAFT_143390 [Coniophora puteana RWD-64-598 SS2]
MAAQKSPLIKQQDARSSMHPALQIDEVCRAVAQECQDWQSTLCALAKTCRAILDPSLDVLWAELKSMIPLLLALPSGLLALKPDMATRRRVFPHTMVYEFRRPLEQADWNVLVRPQYTRSILDPSSFALEGNALEALTEIGNLFPSLRTLTWTDPSLSQDTITALSTAICSWRYLEDLHVAALDRTAFSRLIQLPVLQHLYLHAPLRGQMPARCVPSALEKPFPQLKTMHLEHCAHGLTDAAQILTEIDGRVSFSEFFASTFGVPRETDLRSLIGTVAAKCISNTLTSLTIVEDRFSAPSIIRLSGFTITFVTLAPITSFRRLETLDIDTERNVSLGDIELLELASSWPLMKRLIINPLNGWRAPSRVTFCGLAALLGLLPRLQVVHIAVDGCSTTEIAPLESPKRDAANGILLEVVDLLDSRVGDNIADVAACLAKALPAPRTYKVQAWTAVNLHIRANMDPESGVFSKRWEEVFSEPLLPL